MHDVDYYEVFSSRIFVKQHGFVYVMGDAHYKDYEDPADFDDSDEDIYLTIDNRGFDNIKQTIEGKYDIKLPTIEEVKKNKHDFILVQINSRRIKPLINCIKINILNQISLFIHEISEYIKTTSKTNIYSI